MQKVSLLRDWNAHIFSKQQCIAFKYRLPKEYIKDICLFSKVL